MLIFSATILKDSLSWVEYKDNLIDINFPLQRNLESFLEKSADKI